MGAPDSNLTVTPIIAAVVIGAIAAVLAVVRPTLFVGLAFLSIVMAKSLDQWSGGVLGYADEVIIVVSVVVLVARRLVLRRQIAWFPGLGWFAAFGVLGLASGLINGVESTTLVAAAFLALKGILFGFAVVQVDWDARSISSLTVGGAVVLGIIIVTVVVNVVIPEQWTLWVTDDGGIYYLFGLPAMVGPFVHPGDLGLVLAVATAAVLAYRLVIGRGPVSLALLVGSFLGAASSLRRKTLAGLVVALGWITLRSIRVTRIVIVVLVSLVVVIGLAAVFSGVVQSTINAYVINWEKSPRTLLYLGSANVATTHFPWGAGFGRYGSFLAAAQYSPEYVRLGFPLVAEVAPGSTYLSDTQWPAIVGEAGWFGGVVFAVGLARMWVTLSRGWRSPREYRWERFVSLAGMGWMLQVVVESIAAPVFVTSPSVGMIFCVVAIVASMHRQRAEASKADLGQVDRLIAYQWDPLRPSLGGVDTCLRGLATYSPTDTRSAFVGVVAPGVDQPRELGIWHQLDVGGRAVWFMPVARLDPDRRTRVIPHGLQLAYGLLRYRSMLPSAATVQGHKLESAAVLDVLMPRSAVAYFVHSQSGALAAAGSDSTWKFLGSLQGRLERAFVARADSVVVFNPAYADELSELNDRVTSAPTWFDPRVVVRGLDRDPYRIVWVGRIEAPKDAPLAVRVFEALCDRSPEHPWSLTIIGTGSALAGLAEQIEALPEVLRSRIHREGSRSPAEVADALASSGVLLMTTIPGYEGFPRVLVEGLAAGLPAVVTEGTDTGGLIRDGENGYVRGRDPDDLAHAVIAVMGLNRETVSLSVSHLDGSVLVPKLFAASDGAGSRS